MLTTRRRRGRCHLRIKRGPKSDGLAGLVDCRVSRGHSVRKGLDLERLKDVSPERLIDGEVRPSDSLTCILPKIHKIMNFCNAPLVALGSGTGSSGAGLTPSGSSGDERSLNATWIEKTGARVSAQ